MTAVALLRNESIKTFRRLAFWITLGFFLFIVTMDSRENWKDAKASVDQTFALPDAWAGIIGGLGQAGVIFASLVLVLLVTNEFSWRTARQNVIDGLSREQFFFGKLILIPVVGFAFVASQLFIAGGFAWAGTEGGEPLMRSVDLLLLGGYALAIVGYAAVALFISLAVRGPGPAMAFWFFWVAMVEDLAASLLARIGPTWETVAGWLPINTFNRLLSANQWDPARLAQSVSRAIESGNPPPQVVPTDLLLTVSVGYIVGLVGVSFLWFRRRDL